MLGFEYLTDGTMMLDGRKIVIIPKDDQGKPDVAKSLLEQAYADDNVDLAIGTTSSGATIAMLPVAEDAKKILLVEPAVADSITGDKWNRYIFRSARNSSQDALSDAVALGKGDVADRARWRRTTPSAATASPPSRRRWRSRTATPRWCLRNTRRSRPPTSPRRRSACLMR